MRSPTLTHPASVRCAFWQKFTLEDAIGSHTCSLEANTRVTNGIPLGCPLFLPARTVNCVQTLKVQSVPWWWLGTPHTSSSKITRGAEG
jgi:hypothetical protein